MTASANSKQGKSKGSKAKSRKPGEEGTARRDATRVNTVIYVRSAGSKKAAAKGGSKSTKKGAKKTAAARPRRDRVRDGS